MHDLSEYLPLPLRECPRCSGDLLYRIRDAVAYCDECGELWRRDFLLLVHAIFWLPDAEDPTGRDVF